MKCNFNYIYFLNPVKRTYLIQAIKVSIILTQITNGLALYYYAFYRIMSSSKNPLVHESL